MAWFSNIQSIIVYAYTNTQIHYTYTCKHIQRHYAKPTLLNQALCDYRPVVYNAKLQIYRTITDAH